MKFYNEYMNDDVIQDIVIPKRETFVEEGFGSIMEDRWEVEIAQEELERRRKVQKMWNLRCY